MDAYAGFEPQVGEIRALRTFRVGPGGRLYPLFSDSPWVDGPNMARCLRLGPRPDGSVPHLAPNPHCTCGFYAYGGEAAAGDYPHSKHVLAVVACWGRVIAGTRGLRAEHCRIEALWLSDTVPEDLVADVRSAYPSVAVYRDRARMLAEHPATALDCYQPSAHRRWWQRGFFIAAAAAAVTGVLPAGWLGGARPATLLWGSLAAIFFAVALVLEWRRATDAVAHRQRLLSLTVVLWMLATFTGPAGLLLLRLPLVQVTVVALRQHRAMARAAGRFPADIG